jgi:hypothetical protein
LSASDGVAIKTTRAPNRPGILPRTENPTTKHIRELDLLTESIGTDLMPPRRERRLTANIAKFLLIVRESSPRFQRNWRESRHIQL